MYVVKSPTILIVLDILMFILILFASYTLIFTDTQYKYFIMLIMFAYLYYFIKYRLVQYSTNKPKIMIHSLPQTYNKIKQKDDKGDIRNNSLFLQQYQKRSYEKSKKQLYKQGENDRDKSYMSYMNRSKRINQSFSKNSKSQINANTDNGFNFLNKNKNQNNFLLRDSFLPKFKGMNDSYIKNIQINEETRMEKHSQLQKIMKQRMTQYGKTINKYFQNYNNKSTRQYLRKSYQKVKNLCLNIAKQFYNQNVQNLKNIALALQQIYQIKIKCKEIPEIQKVIGNAFKNQDFNLQINLIQLIEKILKSNKNLDLNLPQRRLKSMQALNNLKNNDYFISKRVEQSFTVSNTVKQKLIRFANQRIRLNSYFYDQDTNNLSAAQLFNFLKLIKQYEQQERQQENYDLYDRFKISQQMSQKILLIFNISRNKINDIVAQFDYTLQFRRKSFMGWIKNHQNMFEVFQTVNSDLGHPHYDVNVNIQPKQKLSCKFGQQNVWSVLFMYMWALQKWKPEIVRNNTKLLRIISDSLDLVIL